MNNCQRKLRPKPCVRRPSYSTLTPPPRNHLAPSVCHRAKTRKYSKEQRRTYLDGCTAKFQSIACWKFLNANRGAQCAQTNVDKFICQRPAGYFSGNPGQDTRDTPSPSPSIPSSLPPAVVDKRTIEYGLWSEHSLGEKIFRNNNSDRACHFQRGLLQQPQTPSSTLHVWCSSTCILCRILAPCDFRREDPEDPRWLYVKDTTLKWLPPDVTTAAPRDDTWPPRGTTWRRGSLTGSALVLLHGHTCRRSKKWHEIRSRTKSGTTGKGKAIRIWNLLLYTHTQGSHLVRLMSIRGFGQRVVVHPRQDSALYPASRFAYTS